MTILGQCQGIIYARVKTRKQQIAYAIVGLIREQFLINNTHSILVAYFTQVTKKKRP